MGIINVAREPNWRSDVLLSALFFLLLSSLSIVTPSLLPSARGSQTETRLQSGREVQLRHDSETAAELI